MVSHDGFDKMRGDTGDSVGLGEAVVVYIDRWHWEALL